MIGIHLINGRTLVARGERLGILRRILIALHLPTAFRSFTSSDWWLVRPVAVGHFQVISDEEAAARKQAADAAEKDAPRVVRPVPGFQVPGGRRH